MPSSHEVVDEFRADLSATQEHPEHLVAKDLFDGLDLRSGRNSEHVLAVESTVGKKDVAVRFNSRSPPKVCTAMTAPGRQSAPGKAS
jgi:hypothetical protein